MANTIVTSDLVTKETALAYVNELRFARNITMQYNDEFRYSGGKAGDTIRVRMPVRFAATEGQAFQEQAIYETTVPVTLEKQINVGMGWSSAQGTTDISDVRERYIKPAAQSIANKVDKYAFENTFLDVYSKVGTPGTTPSSLLTYLQAKNKIFNQAGDMNGLLAILTGTSMFTLANANASLFNPVADISASYKTGLQSMNTAGIARWYESQNVQPYTTGYWTSTSTPLVKGADQTGSSLITDGWNSGTTFLKRGDTFTISGVFTVNPVSYTNTGVLQDFVVTADINDTSGDMTIAISPSIITSGSLQTVSNAPANNAVITVTGASAASAGTMTATTTPQNLVFNKEFATLVSADLDMPNGGADGSRVSSKDWNISIRMVKQYNILTDQNPSRLDVLVGAKTLQARLAARIYS